MTRTGNYKIGKAEYHRSYGLTNRDKLRDYLKNWRMNNKEKRDAYQKEYKKRLKNAEGSFTKHEWESLKMKQEGKCTHCLVETKLSIDHIIPLSKGGSNYITNIQGLCQPCNSKKKNK